MILEVRNALDMTERSCHGSCNVSFQHCDWWPLCVLLRSRQWFFLSTKQIISTASTIHMKLGNCIQFLRSRAATHHLRLPMILILRSMCFYKFVISEQCFSNVSGHPLSTSAKFYTVEKNISLRSFYHNTNNNNTNTFKQDQEIL